jgi:hypothetical protein
MFAADDSTCCICLSEYAIGDQIRQLNICGHHMHSDCITTWLMKEKSCPLCKKDIDQEEQDTETIDGKRERNENNNNNNNNNDAGRNRDVVIV